MVTDYSYGKGGSMDQILGILFVLVMGTIIVSPILYWHSVVTERNEKERMAAHLVAHEIEQAEKEKRKRENLLKHGFPIIGPESFKQAVKHILQELKTKAPHRYAEVVTRMPKAEYVTGDRGFSGRSDGLFTMDGSHYESFRWVFLHEVGHNVAMKERDDHSEEAANAYADMVLREMRL